MSGQSIVNLGSSQGAKDASFLIMHTTTPGHIHIH